MHRITRQLWLLLFSVGAAQSAGWAQSQPASAPPTQPYSVQRGDTLIGIRDRLLVPRADWRVLQRLNRVADPLRLAPGRTLQLPVALLRDQPAVAEALHVFGAVSASRGGGAADPLAPGSTLADGDVVRTGPGASATLRFADGSRLLIRPDSEVRVERLTQSADRRATRTELRLERGAADSTVTPTSVPGARRYQIRTPVANLGVRGTRFRSDAGSGETRVEVLEGSVRAAQGRRETPVAAGFGALAGPKPIRVRELLAPPELAGVPAHVERLPLALKWPETRGATAYRAQVLRDGEADALVADARNTTPAISYGGDDLADGRYILRVRAIDTDGIEGRDASTAFVLKARPEPPFLQRPAADATVYDETVAFAWTRHPAAERYRVQVADTPDFANPRLDRSDITSNEFTFALPLGSHHWRVATIKADGDQGPFGDTQSLTRRDPPPAPPPAESKATDKGLSLRWRASEEPGARYPWQLAGPAGFEAPLREGVSPDATLLLEALPAGRYRLRVRTVNAEGVAGPWGTPQEIEVPHSKWWWLLASPLLLLL